MKTYQKACIFAGVTALSFTSFAAERVVTSATIKHIVVNQAETDKISLYFENGQGKCISGIHGYKSKLPNADMWDKLHNAVYLAASANKKVNAWSADGTCESFNVLEIFFK